MKRAWTSSDANRDGCARNTTAAAALAAGLLLAGVTVAPSAEARSTIREVGNHPDYTLDLEFHFAVSLVQGPYANSGTGFGPGARITVPVVQNGFIKTINNSIAISFGIDWIHFGAFDNSNVDNFYLPLVMQWNFWLTEDWSVFGEPGLALVLKTNRKTSAVPVGNAGARWMLTDDFAMVFRAGFPVMTVGFSFIQ